MKTITLTREISKELDRLSVVRSAKSAAEREEKQIKQAIFDVVGTDPCELKFDNKLMAVVAQGLWSGVDQDKLKKQFPKAYKACLATKPYPKLELAG